MRKVFDIYRLDIRRLVRVPLALFLVIALIILPSLYAWFNIKALWDPYSNTAGIKVAVSIDDKGADVTIPGKKPKHVNVGNELKKKLQKNNKLGWNFVSEKEAQKGVKSGKYYAAIHIPKDFSKDMVSVIKDEKKKPTIGYAVNEKINAIAPKMTESGATTIVNQISSEFIGTVSKSVLKAFNEAGIDLENELPTLRKLKTKIFQVKGAMPEIKKMGDEAQKIEGKLPELKQKANQVVALKDRIPELNQAANDMLTVESKLPEMDSLGEDVLDLQSKIPQIRKMAEGVQEVNNQFGSVKKTLNDGINEANQALDIVNGTLKAVPKVKEIADHSSEYAQQVNKFADQVDDSFKQVSPAVKTNLQLMKQVSDQVVSITDTLKNGNLKPEEAIKVLKSLEEKVADLQGLLESQIETLTNLNNTLPNHPLKDLIDKLKAANKTLTASKTEIKQIREALEAGKEPSKELVDRLNEQAKTISSQLSETLANYDSEIVPKINEGLAKIKADLRNSQNLIETARKKIPDITAVLKNAKQTLTTGRDYLKGFQSKLPEVEKALQEASSTLNKKLEPVIASINEAADFYQKDFPAVKKKINKAGDFIRNDLPNLENEIKNAANLIQTKYPEFEKAVKTAANLSREELPQFEKAINEASDKIITFDNNYDMQEIIKTLRNDANKESQFLANPVKLSQTECYKIPNYGSASSPFYTALCLWVGALLLISLLRVDVEAPVRMYNNYHLYFGRLLTFLTIGLLQSLIVTLGNIFILKVAIALPLWHVIFSMFISMIFMMIVYTLVSLFNNVGKGIAIILLVLQISGAGGNFPIEVSPPFFQAIYPFLPFTYAVSLIRESVGGIYEPTMWRDIIVLAICGIAFILIGTLLKKPLDRITPKLSAKAKKSKLIH